MIKKIKYLLSIAFLFLYIEEASAQTQQSIVKAEHLLENNQIDSLNNIIHNLYKDTLNTSIQTKARLFLLFGRYYDKKNKEEIAANYLTKAEKIYSQLKDSENLAKVNINKFLLFKSREKLNTDKESEIYLKRFYDYALIKKDTNKLKDAYMGYAMLHLNEKGFKKSLDFYDKAMLFSKKLKDTLSLAKIYSNKGLIFSTFTQKQDSAFYFYKKALSLFKLLEKNNRVFGTTLNLGISYLYENKPKKALNYFYQADSIPIKDHKNNSKRMLYNFMANTYEQTKNYKKAYEYLNKYTAFKDSVDIKAQNVAISDIQTKYETAEKEKEILKLQATKAKQQNFLIIFGLAFFGSLLIGAFAYLNLKKKKDLAEKSRKLAEQNQKLEHQKVKSIVKEQELKVLDAVMQGQDKERKRIAEDLHDNLGSKLALLKFKFDSMEIAIQHNKQLVTNFTHTSKLLDDTYQTVRSMSHSQNEREIKHGLVYLVKELAANISDSNTLDISIESFGFEKDLEQSIELMIFRTIQELITNIIKYANAKQITIDLNLFDDALNVMVTDDGKGFDTKTLNNKTNNGMGLKAIKTRIENLNGHLEIDSSIGIGTSITMEIPVEFKTI